MNLTDRINEATGGYEPARIAYHNRLVRSRAVIDQIRHQAEVEQEARAQEATALYAKCTASNIDDAHWPPLLIVNN